MVFFIHDMERTITLHPSFFGAGAHDYVRMKLFKDMEGANTGTYFIVCILDQLEISEGRVIPSNGLAEYIVHFRAVVWRPFRGETLDGVVGTVNLQGFFLDVGPLSVFVPVKMMPSEMKFDGNATPPQYTNQQDQVIQRGTHVRVKITGMRAEVDKMYAIGTINEDYLGLLAPPNPKEQQEKRSLPATRRIPFNNTISYFGNHPMYNSYSAGANNDSVTGAAPQK